MATARPGCRDLVVPGATGFLVPVGERAERVRATEKLFQDPELARRFGTAGRQRVRDRFDVQQMVEQHVAMYQEILAASG